MELDVTHMVADADDMIELSGSRMEHGQDAGRITWRNSLDYGKAHPLLKTDAERDAARAHFREYGAWSEDEINAWSEDELQAITCQDVAAAIREDNHDRLFEGHDRRWYFYLGV